jgi:acyl-CoA thioester hydrolase
MRFMVPVQKKLTFEMVIPLRWGDMDAMNHVNNTLYFRYLESVRIEWFRSLGFVPSEVAQGPVIVNAFCTFMRQLEYPGDLLARHYVGAVGRSTIDTYVILERTDAPGVVYAEGGATVVWSEFKQQKSVPLPDKLRALLA